MSGINFINERKDRIKRAAIILESEIPISIPKLAEMLALNLGVREEKAKEYIRLIVGSKDLEIHGQVIRKPE